MFKIYIANLKKYNEGKLIGKWINLPYHDKDMEVVMDEIGINEEGYDEYFIPYYQNDFGYKVDKNANLEDLQKIAYDMTSLTSEQIETFKASLEVWDFEKVYYNIDSIKLLKNVRNDYELGRYYANKEGFNLSLVNYINFEKYGKDTRILNNGVFTSYGYIVIE